MIEQFFNKIFEGSFDEKEVKNKLEEMYQRGETTEEIISAAESMRNYMINLKPNINEDLLDIVGTGGDGKNSFNISTLSAIVAAGAGCIIAKHCNRGVSSKFGSVDLLEKLGINVELKPEQTKQIIEKIGIGFMYAPIYHPAMKNVAQIRKKIGHRTIFNLLGPLTNPANPQTMLVGAYNLETAKKLSYSLSHLGIRKSFVVHSSDGLDEISIKRTNIFNVENGIVNQFILHPGDYFSKINEENLEVNSAEESSHISKKILYNNFLSKKESAIKKAVILNAGVGIYINGKVKSFYEGFVLAKRSIENGLAKKKLEELVKITN